MPDYGFKVVYGDLKYLTEAGFAKVAHLPFILDSEPGYARVPNRFLIDRGLGLWEPKYRGERRNPSPPTRVTMNNFAHWLANALEWAAARGIELLHAEYSSDLIGGYQQEMLKGIWSENNSPLAPATVNVRVQIALEYQMWAADKGLREHFEIAVTSRTYLAGSHTSSKSHERKCVEGRKGKAKVNKRTLSFPSKKVIRSWLQSVYERPVFGKTEGLIADLILDTAIRREEAACWRVDTLPVDPNAWNIANPDEPEEFQSVLVTIKFGTKGKEYGIDEHGDKIGPEGTIHVPLCLARRIHEYRDTTRLLALKPFLKRGRTAPAQRRILNEAVHLFRNPSTGDRYTGEQIYAFWTRGARPAHWCPHMGRDWWACCYLEERMRQHAELIQNVLKSPNLGHDRSIVLALRDTAQSVIQLEIRPQLRHVSAATSEIYLQWLFNKLRISLDQSQRWAGLDEAEGVGK